MINEAANVELYALMQKGKKNQNGKNKLHPVKANRAIQY
jgi:hypothetical protein